MASDACAVVEIPLTQGKVAIIDAADFELVSQHKWYAALSGGNYYARTTIGLKSQKNNKPLGMHRLILGNPPNALVDHRNGDSLDNRRDNIRLCDRSQNAMNMRPQRGRRFKGVFLRRGRWSAEIVANGRKSNLGVFDTPEDAARAYDAYAMLAFGEFARLNFPAEATL